MAEINVIDREGASHQVDVAPGEFVNVAATSRLACQITITDATAGLIVRIAPEEL